MIDTTKPVDRTGNRYCGPLVVAAVLGTSTGQVAEAIYGMRKARDPATRCKRASRVIAGTYHTELFALLERNGYIITDVDCGSRYAPRYHTKTWVNYDCTQMARTRSGYEPLLFGEWLPVTFLKRVGRPLWQVLLTLSAGTYCVNTPGHWAIASDGRWCETYTRGEWVDFRAAPGHSRQVLKVWRITRKGE